MAAADPKEASSGDKASFDSEEEEELRLVHVRLQVGTWTDIHPALLAGLARHLPVSGLIFPQ